ncbi:MAG TPA: hypothetical protein VFQ62_02865 [Methylomirabilota bacterium]|nr:hypothetical protein [Methylomirabilota bacterium]
MSGKNNVNPDHYKIAGRDRPDDQARARRQTAPAGDARRKKGDEPPANFIPGAAPVGEAPADDEDGEEQADRR